MFAIACSSNRRCHPSWRLAVLVVLGVFGFLRYDGAMNRTLLTIRKTMRSRQKKAFTLIELLVVVSIIALLVSILLPSLSKARESARRAVCSSNLRQIFISLSLYATEHNSVYPHENMMTSAGYYHIAYGNDFRPLMEKYGAEGKVFYYPSGGSY